MTIDVDSAKARRGRTLAVLAGAQLLDFISMSALNIAVPVIARDLSISPTQGAWVPLAYALPLSALLLPMGRLGDVFGYRNIFVFGVALLAISNVFCALSPGIWSLVLSRALQGLGAAANMPSAAAIISNLYEAGPPRAKAMGMLGSMSALGSAVGILLGGIVTQSLGWRYIFWVMLPIATVLTAIAPWLLPDIHTTDEAAKDIRNFDFAGTFTWLAGILAVVFVLSTTTGPQWTEAPRLIGLTTGLVLIGTFILIETRTTQLPLLPTRLFRTSHISVNALLVLLVRGGAATFVFLMSLKLQLVLHLSPLETSLQSIPMSIAGFLFSFLIAPLIKSLGHRPTTVLGFSLTLIGSTLFLVLVKPAANFWCTTLPSTLLFVIGTPTVFIPAQLSMLAASQPRDFAMVGALFNTAGQLGGPLAIALQAAVMGAAAGSSIPRKMDVGNWVVIALESVGGLVALAFWLLPKVHRVSEEEEGERRPLLGSSS